MITGFEHQVQLSVLIKAVGMGYFLGLLFFLLRLMNFGFRKSIVAVSIRDIVFFVISAFLCFIFSLKYCSGMLRFYVFAGELMGFLMFRIFPGTQIYEVWGRGLERISELTKKLFKCTKKSQKN